MHPTAESYTKEPVRYPALQVVNLFAEGAAVTERYRNMVINRVNDSCLRLAVFDETYRWHFHPTDFSWSLTDAIDQTPARAQD